MDEPAPDPMLTILDPYTRAPRESGPVVLGEQYLDAVHWQESRPQNQPRVDKSWVPRLVRETDAQWRRAILKR